MVVNPTTENRKQKTDNRKQTTAQKIVSQKNRVLNYASTKIAVEPKCCTFAKTKHFIKMDAHFLSFSQISTIDMVLGLFLLLGMIRGFMKGFIREVAGLVALIAGIFIAIHFSYFLLDYLQDYLEWNPENLTIAAFVLTFLIVAIFIYLLGNIFTKVANMLALGLLNRLLGAVFGLVNAVFISSIALMFFTTINSYSGWISAEEMEKSILYLPIENFGNKVIPSAMEKIEEHGMNFLQLDPTDF